jgi:hypothetical protein
MIVAILIWTSIAGAVIFPLMLGAVILRGSDNWTAPLRWR